MRVAEAEQPSEEPASQTVYHSFNCEASNKTPIGGKATETQKLLGFKDCACKS